MVFKKHWPLIARTYWCPVCNVPLLSSRCYKCGGEGYELKLREPGDVRIAFEHDISQLLKALSMEKSKSSFFREGIILLNKTTHIDDAKEVIVDGNIFGIMLYNPFESKWEFRPSYYGALRLIEKDVIEILTIREKIKPTQIITLPAPLEKQHYVVLVNTKEEPVGPVSYTHLTLPTKA